jgi:uncharacterized membrane protein
MKHAPKSLEELKKSLAPVRNVALAHYERLTKLERFAITVTKRIGTMGFFFVIFFWTILWIGWNVFAPADFRFDPYPAFVLWLIISNAIQISLMPLILVGQNLEGKHGEARAEADYEVNTSAEKEIETIIMHLENQNEMLLRILKKINGRGREAER